MKTFRNMFWERVTYPTFPRGYDPYNSFDELDRLRTELRDEMARVWKACIQVTARG